MESTRLIYEVGSLIPALLLGIHATRKSCSKAEDNGRTNGCNGYVLIARLYMAVIALAFVISLVSGYGASYFDQLALQNITSTAKMIRFMAW